MKHSIYHLRFTIYNAFAVYRLPRNTDHRTLKKHRKRITDNGIRGLLTLVILTVLLFGCSVKAEAAPTPSGVTISPAFQQVSIKAAEASHPVSFTIINNRPTTQSFNLSIVDFNTLGESGGLFFVGTNPTELQKKYGLAKWFKLSQDHIALAPKQSIKVQGEILNLPDLTPGGHYGALMIAADNSNQPPALKNNNVAVQPIASSLMFVTKVGGDTHKLSLVSVSAKHSLVSLPHNVNLKFHNNGNTHLIPRGVVSVINSDGKIISKGIINESSSIVLPETSRQYFVALQNIDGSTGAGRYRLKVDFRFDGINQYRSYVTAFNYVPLGLIILLVIVALVLMTILLRSRVHRKHN